MSEQAISEHLSKTPEQLEEEFEEVKAKLKSWEARVEREAALLNDKSVDALVRRHNALGRSVTRRQVKIKSGLPFISIGTWGV